tara:strand:+ start:734 stop:1123 length:390 start_codon:yes stop_codon:yes gene_type:complete
MPKVTLPKSGITGKATSATARAFGKMVTDLEIDIRKLLAKDELTETEKLKLKQKKKQLRDIKAEMSEESGKAGRNINRARSKTKPVTLSQMEEGRPDARMSKGGMPFNKGGMSSHKGNFDMRKGGMFAK